MKFESSQEPAPYLNRQDQWRLLGMVAGLSFVVIAITWAARPQSWYWLIPPDNETTSANQDSGSAVNLYEDAPAFGSGEPSNPFAAPGTNVSREKRPAGNRYSQLPDEWLSAISDQYLGLRADEADTFYRVLAHVSRIDEELREKSARRDVLHVNLLQQPENYRGQLLALSGVARRITPVKASPNEYGIRQTYEIWMTTDDAPSDLWRVVTTSLDPRLPQGESIAAEIKLQGYFLKQYSYPAKSGNRIAPLLLAATALPDVQIPVAPSGTGLQPYIIAFAAIFGIGTILLVSAYHQGDREFRTHVSRKLPVEDATSRLVLQEMQGKEYNPTAILESAKDST
ncbi:MAG: hypothetical protein KDA78_00920 [Planctomycetaceae bacterium]|nr:hypothetical protein [Planctomycetaceae bacterium]